ncbi:MAG: tripartite tricarboxylate transporter TctB family protein, partial [Cellulomonadaceae bacterium]
RPTGDGIGAFMEELQEELVPDAVPDDAYVARPSRRLELVIAVACLALSALVVVLASRIMVRHDTGGIDPRWWPTMLGLVALALSVLLLLAAIFRPPFARDDVVAGTREGWTRSMAAMVASGLFVVLWTMLPFMVVLPVYVIGLVAVFGGRGVKALLIFPAVVCTIIHLLFDMLLRVPL